MFGFPLQIDQKNGAETQNMYAGSFSPKLQQVIAPAKN